MLTCELTISIDDVYFWSDSQTVLKYLWNVKSRYQVFVANRIAMIHDGSELKQWRYVPGKLNPADLASRGSDISNLVNSNWLCGPEFLKRNSSEWPQNIVPTEREEMNNTTVNVMKVNNEASVDCVNRLIESYSSWFRLKCAISWWIRLKEIGLLLRKSKNVPVPDNLCEKSLSLKELDNAELEIIKVVQRNTYTEEIQLLCSDKSVKLKSDLSPLDPFVKDGILRVGGRLKNAKVPFDAKHQAILPKESHVSKLIVRDSHSRIGHLGRNHTLSEIRKRIWIVKAGILVKSILSKCVICRKLRSAVCQQKMADLPHSRVISNEPAFSHVGMDYFGPFEIKVGRSLKKRYGVIFTCFSSRAVHLEISESLDTSSCINAIRRFVARRGIPCDIYSDNGSNLVGAQKELKESLTDLNKSQIENFANFKGFSWYFNPPTASHFGGVWERQIRTVRKVLYGILSEQFLRTASGDEELRTLICEVENIVNSRPLTKVSVDSNDLEAISPNSLIMCRENSVFPPGLFNERDIYARKRWRQIQYLTDLFWKRWTHEYLNTLQKREKWTNPSRNIKIGDVVLVVDSCAPRGSWPLGLVIDTHQDKNGLVRSVKLRTKTSTLIRPIAKLSLILECDD